MNDKELGRRRFLKEGAALAGLAAGAVRSASGQTSGNEPSEARLKEVHAYAARSRFETSARAPIGGIGPQAYTPLQDSVGFITPAPLHFVVSHGYHPPDIDPREHRLPLWRDAGPGG